MSLRDLTRIVQAQQHAKCGRTRLRGPLTAPLRVGLPHGPRNHDVTIIPDALDTMWDTDTTTTWTREGQALELLRQGVAQHFGPFAKGAAAGLSVRPTTAASICPPSSRTSWRSWAPEAPRPLSGHQKATATRSGLSAR